MCFISSFLLLLFLTATVQAQAPTAATPISPQEDPAFRSDVNIVSVDVSVLDSKGQPVAGLTQSDFLLYDNGQPRPIEYFGSLQQSVSILLLLDVSGSVQKHVVELASSARQALSVLQPGDRTAVMIFGKRAILREEFTANPRIVERSLVAISPTDEVGAGTNINQSILTAAGYISRSLKGAPVPSRRVIVILTDNAGINFKTADDIVIRTLQEANIVLESIVVGGQGREKVRTGTNPDFTFANVFHLSDETGGDAIRATQLKRDFPQLIERIRSRYLLQCKPDGSTGTPVFHSLEVRLSPAAQKKYPKVKILNRSGYYTS